MAHCRPSATKCLPFSNIVASLASDPHPDHLLRLRSGLTCLLSTAYQISAESLAKAFAFINIVASARFPPLFAFEPSF